ncbi:MAG: CHAP domain-containing protein [Chloroflexi bacterium]|nr:CHAP domain-containing protein [Chloroflexota bacterium]
MVRTIKLRHIVSAIVAVCCGLFSSVGMGAASRVARETPPQKYLELSGGDWLAGHGIGVYYYPGENPSHVTSDGTLWYECAELAIALYMTLGYGQWKYADGTLIGSAVEMADIATRRPKGFSDLAFYQNGDRTPPRPGDLVVWPGSYNSGAGHVAVVNRVMGNTVEVVQQNIKWDGENLARAYMHLDRDGDTVYIYLTPDYTQVLADGQLFSERSNIDAGTTPLGDLSRALINAGALSLTDPNYSELVLGYAMSQIRSDSRLNPANGVRSVDVTIKYTGDSIWLRPWGGPASDKWIRFNGLWASNMVA